MEYLDLKYLQYAVAVARSGSVTRAAQELYLAQPNLSRAISELERSLGFQLFLRAKRGMTLTQQGKAFLTEAESMLERLSALAREFREDRARQVHFSCVPSSLFVNTILEATRHQPEQSVQCQECYNCVELLENVEIGRSLAAFLILGTEMKEALLACFARRKLRYHSLVQCPAYGVICRTSPLYHPDTNPPSIQYENATLMLNISYFEPIGVPFPCDRFALPPAAKICQGAGRAANLDRLGVQEDLIMLSGHVHSKIIARNNLAAVPFRPEFMTYEYGYVTREDMVVSPNNQTLLNQIEKEIYQEIHRPSL